MYSLGAKAGSMGYAFTAIADDWTAIFYNPAGLTQLSGKGVGIDIFDMPWTNWNNFSVSNKKNPNFMKGDHFLKIYDSEPDRWEKKRTFINVIQPSFGAYFEKNGYHFGTGLYLALASGTRWNDEVVIPVDNSVMGARFESLFMSGLLNFSIAKEIIKNLSIGIGVNLSISKLNFEAHKWYVSESDSSKNYQYYFEQDVVGFAPIGIIGVLYRVNRDLRIGIKIYSGNRLHLRGHTDINHTALAIKERSGTTLQILDPPHYRFGIAYNITPRLLFAFNIQFTDWGDARWKLDYADRDLKLLRNVDVDLNWRNGWYRGGGLEYKYSNSLKLRFGYFYDDGVMPGEFVSITTIPIDQQEGVTTGFGYETKKWILDWNIQYVWGGSKAYTYKHRCWTIQPTLTYKF
jgi:long-chain fatty acid transport protein